MNCSRPSTAPVLSRRAQRSPRALHSGYLAAARENLAPRLSRRALRLSRASQVISRPPQVISSRQVISRGLRISRALQAISSRLKLSRAARLSRAGPGCLEHLRSSRGRLELSREARLSRAGSGYLERSGYLEGSVEITRASRWLGPLRMTRSAQDDSVLDIRDIPRCPATVKKTIPYGTCSQKIKSKQGPECHSRKKPMNRSTHAASQAACPRLYRRRQRRGRGR